MPTHRRPRGSFRGLRAGQSVSSWPQKRTLAESVASRPITLAVRALAITPTARLLDLGPVHVEARLARRVAVRPEVRRVELVRQAAGLALRGRVDGDRMSSGTRRAAVP